MAKTSMIEREKRRAELAKRYAAKRALLKETIRSPKSTDDGARGGRAQAADAAARLVARRGSATAARSPAARAACTGSSASAARKLREATMRGDVPGLRKASW